MKHTNVLMATLVVALLTGNIAYGYSFGFTNTLKGPVAVRIKLSGINEPWYYKDLNGKNVRTGRSYEFEFQIGKKLSLGKGKTEFVGRKVAFCLSQIQVAPFEFNKETQKWEKTDEWYDLAPYFVETNYFNKMLSAATEFANGALKTAGQIVKTIGDTMSAGDDEEDDDGKTPKKGKSKEGKMASAAGKGIKKMDLGGIINGIGGIIATTLCKDRSFTIIPNIDEDGNKAQGYILLTHER